MKVLFVNTLYPPTVFGGAEKSVEMLVLGLKHCSIQTVVITLNIYKKTIEIDKNETTTLYRIPLKNIYNPFSTNQKKNIFSRMAWHFIDSFNFHMSEIVNEIINSEKPDIVHTNNILGFSTYVWANAKKSNVPVIHTIRDYYLLCKNSKMFNKNSTCPKQCSSCGLLTFPKKANSNFVDSVVGISEFVLNQHLSLGYFPNAKYSSVIYNSISDNNSSVTSIHKTNLKKHCPLNFGYIGRLDRSKGIELLLDAFQEIDVTEANLIIAGQGYSAYESFLKSKYRTENIFFIGQVPSQDFYENIDILIQPSIWNEPFGRTIVEAYSYACPVIASSSGGIPEIVDNHKTGLRFTSSKRDELLNCIYKFINDVDLVKKMSISAFLKSNEFTNKHIVSKYIDEYNRLLSIE